MKSPVYTPLGIGMVGNGCTCSLCGALVMDQETHTGWHAAQAAARSEVSE